MEEIATPVPLELGHDTAGFDCGNPVLTTWLLQRASRNEGKGSRTFVACLGRQVVGYYALAAGQEQRARAPSSLARNMPDPIPVFVLGRLAVDRKVQGRGLGWALLQDALARSLNASHQIGARAVLVHAIDDRAASFYLHYGFRAFPSDARTLFLPMNEIIAAL